MFTNNICSEDQAPTYTCFQRQPVNGLLTFTLIFMPGFMLLPSILGQRVGSSLLFFYCCLSLVIAVLLAVNDNPIRKEVTNNLDNIFELF